jgi:hypothetical protein
MGRLSDLRSNIKYGIKNLIKWLPVIWKDRDWDEVFLYIIMHKKLESMEKSFRGENAYAVDSHERAREMKIVKIALKRLIDDIYYEEACAVLDVNPSGYSQEVFELEKRLIQTDIEKVFSTEISLQIQSWWD